MGELRGEKRLSPSQCSEEKRPLLTLEHHLPRPPCTSVSSCAAPGMTHLVSSSTPSEASVLAGATRIQGLGHRSTTPVWMEVPKLLDASARSKLSPPAAARERGTCWKGGYRCQRSPARKWRRGRFASRSPRNVIFREVSALPINLFPFPRDALTLRCSCYHSLPATERTQRNITST